MKEEIESKIKKYLESNRWKVTQRDNMFCFYKARDPETVKRFSFLGFSKRRRYQSIRETASNLDNYFRDKKLLDKTSDDILRTGGETFFLSSGIQNISSEINAMTPTNGTYFAIQPVIRSNYQSAIGEGRVSALVNVSTMRSGGTLDDHIRDIDLWCDWISKNGLYLGDFVLQLREVLPTNKTAWKSLTGVNLKFKYGDFELGTASLLYPDTNQDFLVSDIGFGLERINWGMNKTPSFFDIIGPLPASYRLAPQIMDTARTACLMALSGISEDHEDQFRVFRKYLQTLSLHEGDFQSLTAYYYSFWKIFIDPVRSESESSGYIQRHLNYERNLDLLRRLKIAKVPKSLNSLLVSPPNIFVEEIIRRDICTMDCLRGIYGN